MHQFSVHTEWKCSLHRVSLAISKLHMLEFYFPVFLLGFFTCCSAAQSCLTLCNPMDCSTPGFPVLHHLLEFAQTHIRWVGDAIQPSHPVTPFSSCPQSSSASGSFQWVSSSHQVAKVLELQHQSFQRIFRVDFLLGLIGLISLQPRDSQES